MVRIALNRRLTRQQRWRAFAIGRRAKTPDGLHTYIFLKRVQNERFQLTQALVDSGSSPLFHDWLG